MEAVISNLSPPPQPAPQGAGEIAKPGTVVDKCPRLSPVSLNLHN